MEKKPYKVVKSKNATIKNKTLVQNNKVKRSRCCGGSKKKNEE